MLEVVILNREVRRSHLEKSLGHGKRAVGISGESTSS